MGVARVRGTSWTDTDLIVRVISPKEHAVAGKEFHSLVAAAYMWHGFEDKKTKKPLTDEQVGLGAWRSDAGVPLAEPEPIANFSYHPGETMKVVRIKGLSWTDADTRVRVVGPKGHFMENKEYSMGAAADCFFGHPGADNKGNKPLRIKGLMRDHWPHWTDINDMPLKQPSDRKSIDELAQAKRMCLCCGLSLSLLRSSPKVEGQ